MPATRMNLLIIAFLVISATQLGVASATLLDLDFEGAAGAQLDGETSVVDLPVPGEPTLLWSAEAFSGTFNQTSSGFGINAFASGDDTDALDVLESALFSMSTTTAVGVKLINLEFDRVTSSPSGSPPAPDEGLVEFFKAGESTAYESHSFTNATLGSFNRLTLDKVMLSGESMKITHVAGNGFGLEFVRLDVAAQYYNPPGGAVPEPAAAMLLLLGCAGLLGMRRRR